MIDIVAVDFETFSLEANAVIKFCGAVKVTNGVIVGKKAWAFSNDCQEGRHISCGAVEWWLSLDREVWKSNIGPEPIDFKKFITEFNEFVGYEGHKLLSWGTKDHAWLESIYTSCNEDIPFDYRDMMCARAVGYLHGKPPRDCNKMAHNCVDDAEFVANVMINAVYDIASAPQAPEAPEVPPSDIAQQLFDPKQSSTGNVSEHVEEPLYDPLGLVTFKRVWEYSKCWIEMSNVNILNDDEIPSFYNRYVDYYRKSNISYLGYSLFVKSLIEYGYNSEKIKFLCSEDRSGIPFNPKLHKNELITNGRWARRYDVSDADYNDWVDMFAIINPMHIETITTDLNATLHVVQFNTMIDFEYSSPPPVTQAPFETKKPSIDIAPPIPVEEPSVAIAPPMPVEEPFFDSLGVVSFHRVLTSAKVWINEIKGTSLGELDVISIHNEYVNKSISDNTSYLGYMHFSYLLLVNGFGKDCLGLGVNDMKGIPFNPRLHENELLNDGRWVKRQGVSKKDYDNWFCEFKNIEVITVTKVNVNQSQGSIVRFNTNPKGN